MITISGEQSLTRVHSLLVPIGSSRKDRLKDVKTPICSVLDESVSDYMGSRGLAHNNSMSDDLDCVNLDCESVMK